MKNTFKIIVFGVTICGLGLVLYSIYLQNTILMVTGLGFIILSFLMLLPSAIKESNDIRLKLKNDYNAVIDLIEEDKLEDAMDYTDKHIKSVYHKTYLTGIIIGRNGKNLTKIKLEK